MDKKPVLSCEFIMLVEGSDMIVESYYYDFDSNCLIDENGEPYFDMFQYMQPWEYHEYKRRGGTLYFQEKEVVYEFVFPIPWEDERNPNY
jgi:hypothetical protein